MGPDLSWTPEPGVLLGVAIAGGAYGSRWWRVRTGASARRTSDAPVWRLCCFLGALLATSASLFTILKLIGAGYLMFLGIKLWRAPVITGPMGDNDNLPEEKPLKILLHSYVVTALLPVIIPSQGRAGHLIMASNTRPVRSLYLFNLLDKIILDNPATQFLLRHAFRSGLLKLKQIPMVPGNLYFFWGYRTVHANEACDPDKIRATALFHFGDPHADSGLRRFTGRAKSRARTSL